MARAAGRQRERPRPGRRYALCRRSFRSIGDAGRSFIAAIHVDQATDRNGTLEEGFHADTDAEVFTISVAGDSIYVGGAFRAIGSKARGGYAVLDRDGTVQ